VDLFRHSRLLEPLKINSVLPLTVSIVLTGSDI